MPEFIWISGTKDVFEDARLVRRKVFCEEQKYSLIGEFDEKDSESMHVIGYNENKEPICTARFFNEEGFDIQGVYHVGRVAVLKEMRGSGTGAALLNEVVRKAKEMGASALILNSQADKYGFYEKSGFVLTGKEMLDEGQPHVEMRLDITTI